MQSIQMQLSMKQKSFFWIFSCRFKFGIKFWKILKKNMTLIADVFRKLQTTKDDVRQMSKKSRLRRLFNKRNGERSETLLKSAWQHLYFVYWSL